MVKVSDVMTSPVVTIRAATTVAEALSTTDILNHEAILNSSREALLTAQSEAAQA